MVNLGQFRAGDALPPGGVVRMGDCEDGSAAAAAAVSGLLVADLLPDLRRNQSYGDAGGGGGPPTPSSVEAQVNLRHQNLLMNQCQHWQSSIWAF